MPLPTLIVAPPKDHPLFLDIFLLWRALSVYGNGITMITYEESIAELRQCYMDALDRFMGMDHESKMAYHLFVELPFEMTIKILDKLTPEHVSKEEITDHSGSDLIH